MSKRYMRLVGALYGEQSELKGLPALTRKQERDGTPFEEDEQMAAACWLDKNNILYYHCPNGGKRNYVEACKLKAMGVKAGVPDICIPIPSGSHHGLYIELKRQDGGKLSKMQATWLAAVTARGYLAKVANGCEEAKKIVSEYLSDEDALALAA